MNRSADVLVPIAQCLGKGGKDRSQKASWPFPTFSKDHASGDISQYRL